MRRSITVPMVLAAALLVAVVGPVQAAPGPPAQVDLFGCATFGEGAWTIDYKKDVYIKFGWATSTWRQLRRFLDVSKVVVRVDGERIRHSEARWGLPAYEESFEAWVVWWSARVPRFAEGESREITFQVFFEKRHFDGFEYYGPGKLYDSPLSCTVTAQSAQSPGMHRA